MMCRPTASPPLLAVLVLALVVTLVTGPGATTAAAETEPAPWRGSAVTYRNVVSALTAAPDAELTYNPYWAMAVVIRPRWWFDDVFEVSATLAIERELTNSDFTTQTGETLVGDLVLSAGAHRFLAIPVVDIGLSADLALIAPTSKVSQARSLMLAVRGGLSLDHTFDLLEGLTLGYGFQGMYRAHRFTTSTLDSPYIPGCATGGAGCEPYLQTGLRNADWRLINRFELGMAFTSWLSFGVDVAILTDHLYPLTLDDSVTHTPQQTTDWRHTMSYGLALTARPMPSLAVRLGASTANPQLAPDSSRREPFFNRYTTIYLDLSLDIAGLVSQLSPSEAP